MRKSSFGVFHDPTTTSEVLTDIYTPPPYHPTPLNLTKTRKIEGKKMPIQAPIPPLLSPLLSHIPPAGSLVLLTTVLANPTNWLLLRFLYTALKSGSSGLRADGDGEEKNSVQVVLVSWLRAWEWWKEGGRKLVSFFLDFFGVLGFFFGFFGFFGDCGGEGCGTRVAVFLFFPFSLLYKNFLIIIWVFFSLIHIVIR